MRFHFQISILLGCDGETDAETTLAKHALMIKEKHVKTSIKCRRKVATCIVATGLVGQSFFNSLELNSFCCQKSIH